jgi:hypothetical protein
VSGKLKQAELKASSSASSNNSRPYKSVTFSEDTKNLNLVNSQVNTLKNDDTHGEDNKKSIAPSLRVFHKEKTTLSPSKVKTKEYFEANKVRTAVVRNRSRSPSPIKETKNSSDTNRIETVSPCTVPSSSHACWYFHAVVNGEKTRSLFDTGSPWSILSKQFYEQLQNKKPTLNVVDEKLTVANGSILNILGKAIFQFSTEAKTYDWEFLVADLKGNNCLVGQDFIAKHGRSLSWKSLEWQTKAGIVQLHKLSSNCVGKVSLLQKTIVPPLSEIQTLTKANYPLYENNYLIEPFKESPKKGLLIARSLVATDGTHACCVFNATDKPVVLKQGQTIGTVNMIEQVVNTEQEKNLDYANSLPEHLRPLIENISSELTKDERSRFTNLIMKYQDIFVGPDGKLGQAKFAAHKINTGEARPIKVPPRKYSPAQREVIENEIDKMLDQNIIRPSDSPWSSPICLVKKSDGSWRFAIDYRQLNSVTVTDAYPLPNTQLIFDTLAGSKFYSCIDLASGYWQVPMHPEDQCKTAFATPSRGLHEFLVMPFGLVNAGATFERLIELVLGRLQWRKCLCYLDDVVIPGHDFESALENLTEVFERLRQANLKLKPSKCKFFQKQVSFLGHVISEKGVSCDPKKISAVIDWPQPENKTQIKSFLGLVNYYRPYIPDCAEICQPLTELTKKKVRFRWNDECEKAFNLLKSKLTESPVLAYPSRDGIFILETDASAFGIAAILSQIQDKREVVIAYASKALSASQQNYCTTMRELLAVVTFVRHFRHYLLGKRFEIRTDHASLVWLKNFKDADGMLSRWLSILFTFDFEIVHRKGSHMKHVDALSRSVKNCKHGQCVDCAPKKTDCVLSCHKIALGGSKQSTSRHIADGAVSGLELESPDNGSENTSTFAVESGTAISVNTISNESESCPLTNWVGSFGKDELRKLQLEDPCISVILLAKENDNIPTKDDIKNFDSETKTLCLHWELLTLHDGVLYKQMFSDFSTYHALILPQVLRKDVFDQLHVKRISGHFGRDRTLEAVKKRFYWPNMSDSIKRWCVECDLCARCKPGPGVGKSPLQQFSVSRRFQVVAIDICGPLPISDSNNEYIMVVGDYFTKWKEAFAIPDQTAFTVADKLVTEVICRFGCPEQIHTDQGRNFTSKLFTEVCKFLEIDKTRTCPYRPQSDGLVERFMRTLKQMLSTFCYDNQNNWDEYLPYLMMAYRATEHSSTKCTPNMLMFGQETKMPLDLMYGSPPNQPEFVCSVRYVEWLQAANIKAYETAHRNILGAAKHQRNDHDKTSKIREFKEGDYVWRWYPPNNNQKLELGWIGPYKIIIKRSSLVYAIQKDPNARIIHVHVDHLKLYSGAEAPSAWQIENCSATYNDDNHYDIDNIESDAEDIAPLTPVKSRFGRSIRPRQIYSP